MDIFQPAFSSWLNAPAHQQWLAAEGLRLLAFAKASKLAEGFGNLDEKGCLAANAHAETMNTARMTHSFAMAHIQGLPGFAELVDHGVKALSGPLRDAEHGGWFAAPEHRDGNTDKAAYLHAFVALAASSAVVAQRPGAQALLDDAIDIIDTHFWSEEEGAMRESFNRDWSVEEAYRGANSNMHATEAFLALADVTDDNRWLVRAQRIVERVIHGHAAANDYLVVEHFDRDWQPLREYNHDNPADGFRPYGTTPGHGFEWARLMLHLEAARVKAGMLTPGWLAGAKTLRPQLPSRLGCRRGAGDCLHPRLGQSRRGLPSPALDPLRSQRRRQRAAKTHRRCAIRTLVPTFLGILRQPFHRPRKRQLVPRTRSAEPPERRYLGG
jgi:mannose/cellobiose epimerase-like protein (N-acyl-D-glucosamine 2-epimerase family)